MKMVRDKSIERIRGGKFFWGFKGIMEIILAFIILGSVSLGYTALNTWTQKIVVMFLIFFLLFIGTDDLRYYVKLLEKEK